MAQKHPADVAASATAQAPTATDIQSELERLRAENDRLKGINKATERVVTFKVSEKGALSVYGMGRFPVSLYREQWDKILDRADEIRAFIKDHDAELKRKEIKD